MASSLPFSSGCSSPAAFSFNVSCYTEYEVKKSDLTGDIVGHLLHFAYIYFFFELNYIVLSTEVVGWCFKIKDSAINVRTVKT